MKSIFTSFVNRPNSKSTDPSDCFLGRSIPSYVVFIAVFLTYYIVFQSFYNFIESKDPGPITILQTLSSPPSSTWCPL